MVQPGSQERLRAERAQEAAQRVTQRADAGTFGKRQNEVESTTSFVPVVIGIALDSNGNPISTTTLADSSVATTPTAITPTDQTSLSTPVAAADPGNTVTAIANSAELPSETLVNSSPITASSASILATSAVSIAGIADTAKSTSSAHPATVTETIFIDGSTDAASPSATSARTATGASPPAVAGAAAGSIGGTALILLLIVLFLRWRKYRRDNKPVSQDTESIKALHTGPAPIMAHNSARSVFYPASLGGRPNRLSDSPERVDSPYARSHTREIDENGSLRYPWM